MFDKICGYELDKQQLDIVFDNSKYMLVVAGAGSGKTLTILGKVYYLLKYKNIKPEEILCISFTKNAADNLKNKIFNDLGYDVPTYTFHKLSLLILENDNYTIADNNLLFDVVNNFFNFDILNSTFLMKLILKYFDVKTYGNTKDMYLNFYNNNSSLFDILTKTIIAFISLFKCNNYLLEDFILFSKKIKFTFNYKKYKLNKQLLTLIVNIYIIYEEYLKNNNEIDFNDMLILASNKVKNSKLVFDYKYIIIDEYQDTSFVKFNLIKNIIDNSFSKLMVVGDDFQSIYRFTGCDLALFIDFTNYFSGACIKKIETTYRNSKELVFVAGNFVMKNKHQIKKNLTSFKTLDKPIKIYRYKNVKDEFENLIKLVSLSFTNIMMIGRNNNDIFFYLNDNFNYKEGKVTYKNNSHLNIYYLTAHKSKGLEEDCVIIINLYDNVLGFPSKIKNSDVLNLVSIKGEKFLYAEERRLFYVALTRTKNNVYLFCPNKNKSSFVEELIYNYKKYIEFIN